jgi:hypothetical protein
VSANAVNGTYAIEFDDGDSDEAMRIEDVRRVGGDEDDDDDEEAEAEVDGEGEGEGAVAASPLQAVAASPARSIDPAFTPASSTPASSTPRTRLQHTLQHIDSPVLNMERELSTAGRA